MLGPLMGLHIELLSEVWAGIMMMIMALICILPSHFFEDRNPVGRSQCQGAQESQGRCCGATGTQEKGLGMEYRRCRESVYWCLRVQMRCKQGHRQVSEMERPFVWWAYLRWMKVWSTILRSPSQSQDLVRWLNDVMMRWWGGWEGMMGLHILSWGCRFKRNTWNRF